MILFAGTFTICSSWENDRSWSICWSKTNMENFVSVLWNSLYMVICFLIAHVTWRMKIYDVLNNNHAFLILLCSRCMLHNFGGNLEMYGVLDAVGSGPVDARVSANSTMVQLLFTSTIIYKFLYVRNLKDLSDAVKANVSLRRLYD